MKIKLIFILIIFSGVFYAQVINIESKRFLVDSNGFTGKTDLSFSINQNIQKVVLFQSNVHAQYKWNRHRVLGISDLTVIQAGEEDFVNAGYAHLRYGYEMGKRITVESFVQAQYNLALRLDRRYLAGTGPRFSIIRRKNIRLYAATLYMYEYQSQNKDSTDRYSNRLSSYLTFNMHYRKLDFSGTIFYQPNLADFQDYRIAYDSSLEFAVSRLLAFKAGFNFLFDTRQPIGVPAFTYYLRNGISLRF